MFLNKYYLLNTLYHLNLSKKSSIINISSNFVYYNNFFTKTFFLYDTRKKIQFCTNLTFLMSIQKLDNFNYFYLNYFITENISEIYNVTNVLNVFKNFFLSFKLTNFQQLN
jgi:hypothetical protein